ncbi:DNA independent RNA polymerase I transcription factor [Blastocladiella emersonii ATCC 22665]|nr:DNA independent RNA polymerase I transcription factor [Blastocladiella emersonii ATCC 22665]
MAPDTTILMLVSFVQSALRSRAQGSSEGLDDILAELARLAQDPAPESSARLVGWLTAINQSVSSISRHDARLVDALLALPWLSRDDHLAAAGRHLIENLASAQPHYAVPIVRSLIKAIHFRRLPSTESIPEDVYYHRLHTTLSSVLAINPAGPSFVMPLLASEFPHRRLPLPEQQAYVDNLLRILSYAPVLREQVFSLIVDRIVQIDIELQVDVDDLTGNPDDAQFLFEMDGISPDGLPDAGAANASDSLDAAGVAANGSSNPHGDGGDDDDGDSSDDESDAGGPIATNLSAEALMFKLDTLLYVLLTHVNSPAATQHCTRDELFAMLLRIFGDVILPTHKSRHTQFLVFHLAGQAPQYIDAFMGLLVRKAVSPSEPPVIRVASALYVASFIARASYLQPSDVIKCFTFLAQWCATYVAQHEHDVAYPDVDRFAVFYAVAQAVLYMFCYRWRELVAHLGPHGGLHGFESVILSKFNPLKVLPAPIVAEFARLTHELDIMYCYAVIQRNKRVYIPTKPVMQLGPGHAAAPPAASALDGVFPFDPCKLPMTSTFIDPIYRLWSDTGAHPSVAASPDVPAAELAAPHDPASPPSPPMPFAHHGDLATAPNSRNASSTGTSRRRLAPDTGGAGGAVDGAQVAQQLLSVVGSGSSPASPRAIPVPIRGGSTSPRGSGSHLRATTVSPSAGRGSFAMSVDDEDGSSSNGGMMYDPSLVVSGMEAMSISPMAQSSVLMNQLGMAVRQ